MSSKRYTHKEFKIEPVRRIVWSELQLGAIRRASRHSELLPADGVNSGDVLHAH